MTKTAPSQSKLIQVYRALAVVLFLATASMSGARLGLAQGGHNADTKMRAVNPPGANIPGISQAMAVESGRLVFLSGHVPLKSDGSVVGPGLEAQLEQVFSNIRTTLAAAGADFSNVARLTIYIRDYRPEDLPTIRNVRDRFVNTRNPPASALVGVSALFRDNVRVEVDAIAVLATD
ncbi:MAG: RidA family protein [Pseudomonadota bacterium]